jgi:shikimate kinase
VTGPLFLIGYRGTGKSTIGPLLAARLGWSFADADAELEARHGETIRQMFETIGEAGFRDRESALLNDLVGRPNSVIATGGGVILRPENRAVLQRGEVVWLTADIDTIEERLQADPTTHERRPALSVGGRAEIETILAAREPLYRSAARQVIDTASLSPEEAVDAILATWKRSN